MGRFRLVCSLAFVFSGMASAKSLDPAALQRLLKQTKAGWTAGVTSVSRLSGAERKMKLGAQVDNEVVFSEPQSAQRPSYPASFDWRNKDGVNYMSHLLDQGRCGSCVAFAAVGALETQMNIAYQTPNSPWSLSTQHLFGCGGGGCETGWSVGSAMSYLKNQGIPDENCFPYTSGQLGEDVACSKTCKDANSRSIKIASYSAPTMFFVSNDKIKSALMQGPLVTTMRVYEDFMYYKSGVYKHITGEVEGGHAVMLVGWSDADKAWIARNSWGPDWGEDGYFRIAWSDSSGVGNSTYKMTLPPLNGFVALAGVENRKSVSGNVDLQISSTFPDTTSTSWVVSKDGSTVLTGSGVFDSRMVADGVYEIQAIAEHAKGKGYSEKKALHVLNEPLTGSISFAKLATGEKLKGDQEINLRLTFSPVPFDRVIFRKKNLATGEVSERSTTNVGNSMNVGWRTALSPNGKYEVSVIGQAGKMEVGSAPLTVELAN